MAHRFRQQVLSYSLAGRIAALSGGIWFFARLLLMLQVKVDSAEEVTQALAANPNLSLGLKLKTGPAQNVVLDKPDA